MPEQPLLDNAASGISAPVVPQPAPIIHHKPTQHAASTITTEPEAVVSAPQQPTKPNPNAPHIEQLLHLQPAEREPLPPAPPVSHQGHTLSDLQQAHHGGFSGYDSSSAEQTVLEPDSTDQEQDDEGYNERNTVSYMTSIASSIRRGREENGRIYPSYGAHDYGLPVDERELDRQDMAHRKYTLVQHNRLFLAPLKPEITKILDLGTGTGIWAIEMSELFPNATVIGTDIAAVQPNWVSPNCFFEIDDAEAEWLFDKESFDYIHNRDFYLTVRNWPRLIKQAYDHLKPGGWLELCSIYPVPQSDDATLPPNSAYVEVCDTFQSIGRALGTDPEAPRRYRDWLAAAGFAHVRQHVFRVPSTPWPRDPRMKQVGAMELYNLLDGAQGFLLRGYTKEFGRSREELELLIMRMRGELGRKGMHGYVQFYVAYGQKPPEATTGAPVG